MKASEAPEKIILSADRDTQINNDEWVINDYTDNIKIEYIRKDAFIKKAVEWLSRHFYDEEYQSMDNEGVWICADELINDFKEYMKGE